MYQFEQKTPSGELLWPLVQPSFANAFPFYYSPLDVPTGCALWDSTINACFTHITASPSVLAFFDRPGDGCFFGGLDVGSAYCPLGSPPGQFLEFKTALVGVLSCATSSPGCNSSGYESSAPLFQWTWYSTYNGGSQAWTGLGGVTQTASVTPPAPDTGTGGVTITSINGVPLIPSPPSGTACNGIYNGTFNGDITISTGQTCTFVGGGITGNVEVTGGTLVLSGTSVDGSVEVYGGGTFRIAHSTVITGGLEIQGIPAGSGQNQICGSTVNGNLQFQNNATAVQIGSSQAAACPGNTIGLNLLIDRNTASVQVFNNAVKLNVNCEENSSITGGGNTALHKHGQCAAF